MIGVCIKYFHKNYGGMLQAYATVSELERRGLAYELIRYEKRVTPVMAIRSLPRLLNRIFLNDKYEALLKKAGEMRHPEFARNERVRREAFHRFAEQRFTRLSPVFKGYEALCAGAKRYDTVLTGSDQLWSPAGLPTNYYNLMFVPDGIRRVSYASSFGVGSIPWYQKKRTARFLKRLDHISMRESRGAEIVAELTGRQVPTVLDPVLLFDRQGWEKLIPVRREIEEPYIFAYFLGANPEHREAVRQAAKEMNCRIVTLRHLDRYVPGDEQFGDIALYDVGPDRFLNLLRGAEGVCTDSYHGACFSVLHERPFIAFDRYAANAGVSKNSRLDTLCRNLGLEGRRYDPARPMAKQLLVPVDHESVEHKLSGLRALSMRYLDKALGDE